ncbi:hypothetical protein HaLaN_29276 [Haematococcus lacustris]|uniref:Uncharacterized protein n=1 Tax=Haematococcus lacustris TaxID=44745 RepID=A0A6A0AC43_HAELA|nr:hypothetical protein HaLaN_29276 [Haematococcus lacustris]
MREMCETGVRGSTGREREWWVVELAQGWGEWGGSSRGVGGHQARLVGWLMWVLSPAGLVSGVRALRLPLPLAHLGPVGGCVNPGSAPKAVTLNKQGAGGGAVLPYPFALGDNSLLLASHYACWQATHPCTKFWGVHVSVQNAPISYAQCQACRAAPAVPSLP